MSGWEELGPELWITPPQCPMKGQSRTTLRLKQSCSLPHFPPAPRRHITHSAHNKQNRPKRRGMKWTVCFCLLLRPSKRRTAGLNRLADFVKATACRKCSIRPSGCGGKGGISLLGRQCQGEDDVVWWWDQGLHMKEAGCLGAAVGTIVVNNLHAFSPSLKSWLLWESKWALSSLNTWY